MDIFHHYDLIKLSDKKSVIEVLKVGTIQDRGLKITEEMLNDFVSNFNAGVYGSDIQVNLGHQREGEAAGWVHRLIKEGPRLLAEVEWTPLGVDKVESKQYRFTSSELALNYTAPDGKKVKNVFIGVALTNVPAVKGMEPVTLSEQANLFLNSQNMNKLKEKCASLMAKKNITKEEFGEFKKNADEDGSDEAKGMCAELEKKIMPVKEEKAAEKKVVKNNEEVETASLAEVTKLQEQLAEERKARLELQEQVERKDLSERVEKELTLSADRQIGFVFAKEEDKKEVIDALMEFTKEQRDQIFNLFTKVRTVDLSTRGGMGVKIEPKKAKTEDDIVDRAAELLSEGKAKNISEAQKMAMAEAEKGE